MKCPRSVFIRSSLVFGDRTFTFCHLHKYSSNPEFKFLSDPTLNFLLRSGSYLASFRQQRNRIPCFDRSVSCFVISFNVFSCLRLVSPFTLWGKWTCLMSIPHRKFLHLWKKSLRLCNLQEIPTPRPLTRLISMGKNTGLRFLTSELFQTLFLIFLSLQSSMRLTGRSLHKCSVRTQASRRQKIWKNWAFAQLQSKEWAGLPRTIQSQISKCTSAFQSYQQSFRKEHWAKLQKSTYTWWPHLHPLKKTKIWFEAIH